MIYHQIYGKPLLLIRKRSGRGKVLRLSLVMNGFAGLSPLKLQRRGRSMSAGSSRNLRKGCVALAVGMVALIGRIRR